MKECPSSLILAQFVADDMGDGQRLSLQNHLTTCAACQSMLGEIRANAAEYETRADMHRAKLVAGIMRRGIIPRPTFVVRFAVGAIAAAAALLLILFSTTRRTSDQNAVESGSPDIQFKGRMTFEVVAKRQDRQFKVIEGAELLQNDALRFVLTTDRAGFVTVFSIDQQGRITPFYPDTDPREEPEPMAIDGPGRRALPDSIILDDALGDGYYVVVFSENSFDRNEIHERIRQVKKLEELRQLKDGSGLPTLAVESLWVTKVIRPPV